MLWLEQDQLGLHWLLSLVLAAIIVLPGLRQVLLLSLYLIIVASILALPLLDLRFARDLQSFQIYLYFLR